MTPTKRQQPQQRRDGQRIAQRRVHNPKTRLLGPPYPGEAGHSTLQGGDGSPKGQAPINPPALAGGAKESYIGRPSAQVTFRNITVVLAEYKGPDKPGLWGPQAPAGLRTRTIPAQRKLRP